MSSSLRRTEPYFYALLGVAAITVLIGLVRSRSAVPDLSMVYLVLVLWLGARYGILPAALAGVAAFLAYDFFFVPPYGTLVVRGPNELLGLVLLLAAALVTGQLAASLRQASARSTSTAEEATTLYELATGVLRLRDVNSAIDLLSERARRLPAVARFSLLAVDDGVAKVAGGDDLAADISPRETIVAESEQAILPTMAIDRVRRHLTKDGTVILHLFTTHLRPVPDEAADQAETA